MKTRELSGARLRVSVEFNQVFKEGKRYFSENLILISLDAHTFRYGVAVSRKARTAVKRNFVKRRMRELVRRNVNQLPVNKSLILLGKVSVGQVPFYILESEFLLLLRRLQ